MGVARFESDPERSTVRIDGSSTVHPVRARATGLEGRNPLALVDAETRRRIGARRFPEIVGTVALDAVARRTEPPPERAR